MKKEATGPIAKAPVVIAHKAFTPPPPGKMLIYGNGPQGGVNWQPVSFNEKTHMIYVCSSVSWIGLMAQKTPFVKAGENWTGVGGVSGVAWPEATGTFSAIDATSGEVKWQKRFPDPCYSGTSTTGGNLVFVGRNSGELEAYDAQSGNRLWHFQTGAGANNQPTFVEQGGKEYVLFLSGGNSLQATPHGDSLWLFGLDGTLGPAPTPGKGSGVQHAGEGTKKSPATTKGDADGGQDGLPAELHGLPRPDRARRQRRPRPDVDPEREELQYGRGTGRERRRRDAGLQGSTHAEADRRRVDVRHAEDHEQQQVVRRLVSILCLVCLAGAVSGSASATTEPSLTVRIDVGLTAKQVKLSQSSVRRGYYVQFRVRNTTLTRRTFSVAGRTIRVPAKKSRLMVVDFLVRGRYPYVSRGPSSSAIHGLFRVS